MGAGRYEQEGDYGAQLVVQFIGTQGRGGGGRVGL